MKNKFIGQTWRLRYGLLVAGLDGIDCVLVSEDDPRVQVFDSRDNPELKRKFWSIILGCPLEVECVS
jgi:hypothetical protein